jgi:inosine-uridine nucleoside N-ribohydrolase
MTEFNNLKLKKPKTHNEIIAISDPGIDDAIALFVLGAISQEISFISTYGNASATQTTTNLVGIVEFMQRNLKLEFQKDFKVYTGAD